MRAPVSEGIVFFGNFRDRSPKIQSSVCYLEHEEEKRQIVDSAYELMMTELKFEKSLRKMGKNDCRGSIKNQGKVTKDSPWW